MDAVRMQVHQIPDRKLLSGRTQYCSQCPRKAQRIEDVQMFLLYGADVNSKIRKLSGTCKIVSARRFYRNLIATAPKLSYNHKYFLSTRESRNKSHDV